MKVYHLTGGIAMKRVASLLLILMLLCTCTAAGETPLFTVGEPHTSTPEFPLYFETMTAPLPAGSLCISRRVWEPKTAEALHASVTADLQAIAGATGMPLASCTVCIVNRLVNGSIERQGSIVYCRTEDVLSGAYRPLLICAALGTEEYWIGVGLAGCIWGGSTDEAALSAHYAAGDLGVLTLAVPYFIDGVATPEEIAIAQATAISLCRYIMSSHGCEALLTGDGTALRREWLHAIGVDREFDDPCSGSLRRYRFRASSNYALVAVDPHGNTVYLAPMADVATAGEACWFLHDLLAGPEALFALVDAEAPECAALLRSRYGKLRVYCGQDGSWAVPEYREIRLALGSGFMHELTHILVPPAGANHYTTMWQYEGLCYWAGYQVYPMRAQRVQVHQALQLFADMPDPQTPNHRFSILATGMYLQDTPLPEHPEGVDVARYAHAMSLIPLRWPEAAPDSAWAATIHDSYPGLRNTDGNELTEYQSFSFAAFLIDRHGLPVFLRFCMDGVPFESAFGEPYETAQTSWIAWLDAIFP